jgi:hypothetical protein
VSQKKKKLRKDEPQHSFEGRGEERRGGGGGRRRRRGKKRKGLKRCLRFGCSN